MNTDTKRLLWNLALIAAATTVIILVGWYGLLFLLLISLGEDTAADDEAVSETLADTIADLDTAVNALLEISNYTWNPETQPASHLHGMREIAAKALRKIEAEE